MKVTDLKENEVIHCETEEQANAICNLMHEAGLKWKLSGSFKKTNFFMHREKTCYYPKDRTICGLYLAKQSNYTIYKAEQFL